jgi:hypothetical protein
MNIQVVTSDDTIFWNIGKKGNLLSNRSMML